MSHVPTISVIVTADETHGDLTRALESVRTQTFPATEVWIAGDASQVSTTAFDDSFRDRLRWIDVSGASTAAARNAAIRRSRGDLIALLETNAVWAPEKLARCATTLTSAPDDDLVYSPAVLISPEGTRRQPPSPEDMPCGWILNELFAEPWIVDSAAVFRRQVWERHGGFDESLTVAGGQNFYLRAARAHRFALVAEPLVDVSVTEAISAAEQTRQVREIAEMLHRFYAEQGGEERLDSRRAHHVMGELCEMAARLSWAEHNIPMTLRATVGALHYRPTWRSRLFLYWVLWRTRKERVGMNLAPV